MSGRPGCFSNGPTRRRWKQKVELVSVRNLWLPPPAEVAFHTSRSRRRGGWGGETGPSPQRWSDSFQDCRDTSSTSQAPVLPHRRVTISEVTLVRFPFQPQLQRVHVSLGGRGGDTVSSGIVLRVSFCGACVWRQGFLIRGFNSHEPGHILTPDPTPPDPHPGPGGDPRTSQGQPGADVGPRGGGEKHWDYPGGGGRGRCPGCCVQEHKKLRTVVQQPFQLLPAWRLWFCLLLCQQMFSPLLRPLASGCFLLLPEPIHTFTSTPAPTLTHPYPPPPTPTPTQLLIIDT